MATANTKYCFKEFIGMRLKGILFNALPLGRQDLDNDTKTLIFENGKGLTMSDIGTFWLETEEDINEALKTEKERLYSYVHELEDILKLAGE